MQELFLAVVIGWIAGAFMGYIGGQNDEKKRMTEIHLKDLKEMKKSND